MILLIAVPNLSVITLLILSHLTIMITFIKTKNKIIIAIGIIFCFFLISRILYPQKKLQNQVDELKSKTQPQISSTVTSIIAENNFFDSLDYLISSGQFDGANKVITQLLVKSERNDYYW